VQFNLIWLDLDSGQYAAALEGMQRLLPIWMRFPDLVAWEVVLS
jgi:hypothetical protein